MMLSSAQSSKISPFFLFTYLRVYLICVCLPLWFEPECVHTCTSAVWVNTAQEVIVSLVSVCLYDCMGVGFLSLASQTCYMYTQMSLRRGCIRKPNESDVHSWPPVGGKGAKFHSDCEFNLWAESWISCNISHWTLENHTAGVSLSDSRCYCY